MRDRPGHDGQRLVRKDEADQDENSDERRAERRRADGSADGVFVHLRRQPADHRHPEHDERQDDERHGLGPLGLLTPDAAGKFDRASCDPVDQAPEAFGEKRITRQKQRNAPAERQHDRADAAFGRRFPAVKDVVVDVAALRLQGVAGGPPENDGHIEKCEHAQKDAPRQHDDRLPTRRHQREADGDEGDDRHGQEPALAGLPDIVATFERRGILIDAPATEGEDQKEQCREHEDARPIGADLQYQSHDFAGEDDHHLARRIQGQEDPEPDGQKKRPVAMFEDVDDLAAYARFRSFLPLRVAGHF